MMEMRRLAIPVSGKGKFEIDISKFEYTDPKESRELEGYTIYVYTPLMIVGEKLRAICQQMPDYAREMKKRGRPRARDFVDIHALVDRFAVNVDDEDNQLIIGRIFAAKKVPLRLLATLDAFRDFHRTDFDSVLNTVKAGVKMESFDFYFDFVLELRDRLKTLWDE